MDLNVFVFVSFETVGRGFLIVCIYACISEDEEKKCQVVHIYSEGNGGASWLMTNLPFIVYTVHIKSATNEMSILPLIH